MNIQTFNIIISYITGTSFENINFYSVILISSPELAFYIGTGEVPDAMNRAFAGVKFNDGHNANRPLEHTQEQVVADEGNLLHALAVTDQDVLAGAVLCIPARNPNNTEACDVGWMFTVPELSMRSRTVVLEGMLLATTMHLQSIGYKRIETTMGTPAGGGVLRMLGFVKNADTNEYNDWVYTFP